MKRFLFIFFLSTFSFFNGDCQFNLGSLGGYGINSFFNLKKSYSITSRQNRIGTGATVNIFSDTKIDSTTNFRTSLEFQTQKMGIKYKTHSSHYSNSYVNLDYKIYQIKINFDYQFRLNKITNKRKFDFIFGFNFGYILSEKSTGNGCSTQLVSYTDTLGNTNYYFPQVPWERNNSISHDFNNFQFGINLGLEYSFHINSKTIFILQNKYIIDLLNNSFFFGARINVGIKYLLFPKTK